MTANLTPLKFKILLTDDDLDFTPYVWSFGLTWTQVQIGKFFSWQGQIELSPLLGVLSPDDYFDERYTSIWNLGNRVKIQIFNSTTAGYQTVWTLRILHAEWDEDAQRLRVQAADLLSLLNFDRPPQNVGGIVQGLPTARGTAAAQVLTVAGVPSGQITTPSTEDEINYTLASFGGSLIQFAQDLLTPESLFLWVDADEQVRAAAWAYPDDPLISLTAETDCVEFKRLQGEEIIPTRIDVVGTKIQFQGYSNPGTNCGYVYLPYAQITGFQYPLGTEEAQYTQYTATSEETCTTTTGDGVTSLTVDTVHKIPRVTAESQGFTSNPPAGAVIRDPSIQLELITDTGSQSVTTFDEYRRVLSTTEDTLKTWWKLGYHTGTGYSEAEQQTFGIFQRVKTEYTYANTTDTQLTQVKTTTSVLNGAFNANTYPPPSNVSGLPGSAGQYTVTQVVNNSPVGISPGTAPTGTESETVLTPGTADLGVPTTSLSYRRAELSVQYPSSTDQLTALANIEYTLARGRRRGYRAVLPINETLLFSLAPFVGLAVSKNYQRVDGSMLNRNRQFLINSPKIAYQAGEAQMEADLLWIGGWE